jgi:hypothetical protein
MIACPCHLVARGTQIVGGGWWLVLRRGRDTVEVVEAVADPQLERTILTFGGDQFRSRDAGSNGYLLIVLLSSGKSVRRVVDLRLGS